MNKFLFKHSETRQACTKRYLKKSVSKFGKQSNKKYTGFTLIEILVALMVFAILATITSSTLYYAFNNRSRVSAQAQRLNELQLAVSLLQQDMLQIIERPIRSADMSISPIIIGQNDYVEFTRAGRANPYSEEKRSTLQRVAFLCQKDRLVRRTWPSLDRINAKSYNDKVLVTSLKKCHFNYLNQHLQPLAEWREEFIASNRRTEFLPKAIQINLTLQDWGEMNLLFGIPEAIYNYANQT